MNFVKKYNNIQISYLENNKVLFFSGKIMKIKKFTIHIEKKIQGVLIKKVFFIKNTNLISLKINN